MIRKFFMFLAIILITATVAFAETVPDESAAKDLANNVMEKVAVGDFDTAFKLMKPYCPLSATEIDSAALQTKTMREQFGQRYGICIGYEFVDSKRIGDFLLRLRYVEKTKVHALPWVFYFYKTKEGWILNSFDWNDRFSELFQ